MVGRSDGTVWLYDLGPGRRRRSHGCGRRTTSPEWTDAGRSTSILIAPLEAEAGRGRTAGRRAGRHSPPRALRRARRRCRAQPDRDRGHPHRPQRPCRFSGDKSAAAAGEHRADCCWSAMSTMVRARPCRPCRSPPWRSTPSPGSWGRPGSRPRCCVAMRPMKPTSVPRPGPENPALRDPWLLRSGLEAGGGTALAGRHRPRRRQLPPVRIASRRMTGCCTRRR